MGKGKDYGGITGSTYKDCIVPKPDPKSGTEGGMGTAIEGGQAETPGVMGSNQFAKISGGEAGSKGFGPGKRGGK